MPPKESSLTAVNRFIKNAYRHFSQKWLIRVKYYFLLKRFENFLPIASPSNLTDPVKILSTATTILWDDVSPINSCRLDSFFGSTIPIRYRK